MVIPALTSGPLKPLEGDEPDAGPYFPSTWATHGRTTLGRSCVSEGLSVIAYAYSLLL